ncbi:hypothetical protein C4J81_02705 [Deltaproteobacteria bacterium Smac51]|nr:hypothetical protein C4J81_02705 [Deltaproteobacteria bacterium Smac51]
MAENINDITITYEEDGELVVEELEKVILNRGAWTSILFRYRERERQTGQMGPAKATLRRYQKYQGVFKKRDAINLSAETARTLVDTLEKWLGDGLLGKGQAEVEE